MGDRVEAIRNYLRTIIHLRGVPRNYEDREDIVQDVMEALVENGYRPDDWKRVGLTILRHRIIRFVQRSRAVRQVTGEPEDPGIERSMKRRNARELCSQLLQALKDVTPRNSRERDLVDRVFESVEVSGRMPSLRGIGNDLWPHRPQTAAEKWVGIMQRVERWARERGVDFDEL